VDPGRNRLQLWQVSSLLYSDQDCSSFHDLFPMAPGVLSEPASASIKAEPKNGNPVRMIAVDDLAKLKHQLHQDVNSNEPVKANNTETRGL
jgi:hypothetical protein